MQKRHRIFIAINLPQEIKKELSGYAKKWPDLPAKWTEQDNLHITLNFLGDLTDIQMADACIIAKEVAENHSAFEFRLSKITYGPENKIPPKYVFCSGEKSQALSDLKNDLEDALLEKIPYKPDGTGFHPHITLARISEWEFRKIEPEERPEVNEMLDLSVFVESIEVMESELTKSGPRYTIIESHELKQE